MAAVSLPAPGDEFGPCNQELPICQHSDCEETRRLSAKVCSLCNRRIGYRRRFFQEDDWKVLKHEHCVIRAMQVEATESARAPRMLCSRPECHKGRCEHPDDGPDALKELLRF